MKIFLTLVLILFLSAVHAQLDKKTWLVGGSSSFSAAKEELTGLNGTSVSNRVDWTVSATTGYFITDKAAVGLRTSYFLYKLNANRNAFRGNTTRFMTGPFARYYFMKKDKPYNILAEASYQYGVYNIHPGHGPTSNLSVSAGTAIFFNSTASIEILPGYYAYKDRLEDASKKTLRGFLMNISFMLYLAK